MTRIPGPYMLDPDAGLAITGTESTTTEELSIGQHYNSIEVADATVFPDEEGWLVIGFGYDYQAAPVRYFGRLSGTTLSIEHSFKFPKTIPSGANVSLLLHKGPFVPEEPEVVGAFYVTASPAGRVAAANSVDDAVGAGRAVEKTVIYPGDRGIGNEGLPAHGVNKLSDKVSVWGSDELDAEISKLRKE